MLNIGKLAPGGADYYLRTVASGVEDYYTGQGEAPGYWLGSASPGLGLEGRVDPEALRAVLGAADPRTGEPLTQRAGARKVPGFDLTFRAPKSVSVLYGLGEPEVSRQAREAHDAAVAAAMAYLEANAAFSRRGHAGAQRVAVTGFVAAAFRHRTSRAGDPLLHTHVLVANVGQAADDGQWRTIDGRSLYLHAKTAGYLYQSHLRHELTRRLGVEWGPVRNGCADVAGVPDEVIRAFSQRRVEIEARMAARGETSAKAAQVATLATRRAKPRDIEPQALGAQWTARAAALGFTPEHVQAVLARTALRPLEPEQRDAVARHLAGPEGLTERASTFDRRDVVRAWCEQLPHGAPAADVEGLADGFLAQDDLGVVALGDRLTTLGLSRAEVIRCGGGRLAPAGGEPRYSTVELLDTERRILALADETQEAGRGVADARAIDAAISRRSTLRGEQADMVRRLTTTGHGVEVVVGKAGTGKTYALDAAREAWQQSGVRVIGAALAARAAQQLQHDAGIPAASIDALLARLDRPAQARGGLPPGCVLVIDEAGMAGTRKLARLLDHAQQAAAKVVLVGDHRQLPEIDAGGVFRALAERLPAIELTENRRQARAWERAALDELRDGDPAAALAAYQQRRRIVTGEDPETVRERLADDWWDHRLARPDEDGVMIAARLADADDLNQRARARLSAHGLLTGPALTTAGGRQFQAGDQVMALRNHRRVGVLNGTRGTVTAVDHAEHALTIQTDDGDTIAVPARYIDAGHLAHAYAITAHKAQGLTVDRAWVLADDQTYREWGYVALSRARRHRRLPRRTRRRPRPRGPSRRRPATAASPRPRREPTALQSQRPRPRHPPGSLTPTDPDLPPAPAPVTGRGRRSRPRGETPRRWVSA